MNKTDFFASRIRPNLLPEYCNFNTPNTWNVIGGGLIGTVTSSTEQVYDGTYAVKVDFSSGGVIAFNSGNSYMNFTAPKDGAYCISGMVKNLIDHNLTVTFELFVNGIGINTYFESVLNKDKGLVIGWNSLYQTLELNQNDVVSFNFRFGSTIARTVYLDSLKMEFIDDGIYAPSPYSVTPYLPMLWQSRVDTTNTQNILATTNTNFGFTGTSESNDTTSLLSTTGLITPTKEKAVVTVDFAFGFDAPSGADRFIDMFLVVNGVTYRADTHTMTKDAGDPEFVSGSFTLPVGADFKQYGAQIVINSSVAITIENRYISVIQHRN